jgi:hypothetical protein
MGMTIMDKDLYDRVMKVIDHLRGTTGDIIGGFDEAVEDGLLTADEYDSNEAEILSIADNHIFNCVRCGWCLNVDEGGEDTPGGELCCKDCEDEL